MHKYLIDLLVCPVCHGELAWKIEKQRDDRIIEGKASCKNCNLSYPITDEIGIFLTEEIKRDDLWENVSHYFSDLFEKYPEIENKLMKSPLEDLSPADKFFRGMVLEERNLFEEASDVFKLAHNELYTEEYLTCATNQIDFICETLNHEKNPILDLACGRGYLVEEIAKKTDNYIIASDFSPLILHRNKLIWKKEKIYDKISLIAFDARKSPFKDGSIKIMTSNLGLPNIGNSSSLLKELRRIISGKLMAIFYFYPLDDKKNIEELTKYDILDFSVLSQTILRFNEADFKVNLLNNCFSKAKPTPSGVILKDVGIDALPIEETTLEWCVIEAE